MLMDDDIGGLGYCGAMGMSAPRIDGRVGNLALVEGGIGDVEVDFIHDSEVGEGAAFLVYQDGVLMGRATPGVGWSSAPMAEGTHELSVVVIREDDRGLPEFGGVGRDNGRRVWLRWSRRTESDLAGYHVYWDAEDGSVDYGTVVATVGRVEFPVRWADPPDSGTGSGRLTVSGEWTGAEGVNATWHVKVTGAGTFAVDTGSGYGADIAFVAGTGVSAGSGLVVTFEDPAASYDTDDTWDIAVGPRTWWVSGELEAGTYKFDVLPFDEAGNEGTSAGAVTVVVTGEPEAPTGLAGTWDTGTATVTLTWTDSTTASCTYNVYTNWEQIFGERLDAVGELAPIGSAVAAGVEEAAVVLAGNPGRMYFYVRATSPGGIEERNANLVVVDCTAAAVADLAAPSIVKAEAIAGGKVRLTWAMDWSEGEPASVKVYVHTSAAPDWSTAVAEDSFAWTAGTWNVGTFTWESAGSYPGERWFTVRAVDGDGNETDNTDVTSCVPDAAAPGELGGLEGVAT